MIFKNNITKNISDALILDLIQHFYPDVVIENNKYISNMKCDYVMKLYNIHNK